MLSPHHHAELVGWTPDKGSIENERRRRRDKAPALVATGKYVLTCVSGAFGCFSPDALQDLAMTTRAVCACRNAGQARVEWMQKYALRLHEWRKGIACIQVRLFHAFAAHDQTALLFADFFHSSLATRFLYVLAFICLVYTTTFFLYGIIWWAELA